VWYLKRIAELAKRVDLGYGEDTPEQVNTPGVRALYNNLKKTVLHHGLGLHGLSGLQDAADTGWIPLLARTGICVFRVERRCNLIDCQAPFAQYLHAVDDFSLAGASSKCLAPFTAPVAALRSMTAEDIEHFEQALAAWDGEYESETYEGASHGWTVPDNPVFNATQAERAFAKLRELFAGTLS
jgi:hypothetical protein